MEYPPKKLYYELLPEYLHQFLLILRLEFPNSVNLYDAARLFTLIRNRLPGVTDCLKARCDPTLVHFDSLETSMIKSSSDTTDKMTSLGIREGLPSSP